MASNYIVAAGIGLFAAFAVSALYSFRALNALGDIIREKWPHEWTAHSDQARGGGMPPVRVYTGLWIDWLVWGTAKLDVADDRYSALLRTARLRLLVTLLLFSMLLVGLGWLTQDTMPQ